MRLAYEMFLCVYHYKTDDLSLNIAKRILNSFTRFCHQNIFWRSPFLLVTGIAWEESHVMTKQSSQKIASSTLWRSSWRPWTRWTKPSWFRAGSWIWKCLTPPRNQDTEAATPWQTKIFLPSTTCSIMPRLNCSGVGTTVRTNPQSLKRDMSVDLPPLPLHPVLRGHRFPAIPKVMPELRLLKTQEWKERNVKQPVPKERRRTSDATLWVCDER